ncbi:MAG: hypothetical protein V4527_18940 [Pseudomonadota bacterium]
MTGTPHFASEPATIDKHLWRVVVVDSAFGGRRFAYQFAAPGELVWQDQDKWPMFDLSTQWLGLPTELVFLFEANLPAIRKALSGVPDTVSRLLTPTP